MDIRLIVSDIDGTLLPKGGKISDRTKQIVKKCEKSGIPFVLASGRWFPSTVSVAQELGSRGALIVANGGCVTSVDGCILHEIFLRGSDARIAYDIICDSGALITSYVRGSIYRLNTLTMNNRPPEKLSYFGGSAYEVIDNDVSRFESEALTGVYKMEAYSNDTVLLTKLRAELVRAGLSVTSSFPTNIEITSSGLGKGAALKWLCKSIGISAQNVMAFGDNTNDAQMLETAGHPVAMGNAVDEVKRICGIIAPDCSDDGLAKVINKYVFGDIT